VNARLQVRSPGRFLLTKFLLGMMFVHFRQQLQGPLTPWAFVGRIRRRRRRRLEPLGLVRASAIVVVVWCHGVMSRALV
jgi:hypothetical protein